MEGSRPVSSEEVLATLEALLLRQKSVSTLDLLEALPSERLRLDLDALVLAASRWRRQMERHQRLTSNLASSSSVKRPLDRDTDSDPASTMSSLSCMLPTTWGLGSALDAAPPL